MKQITNIFAILFCSAIQAQTYYLQGTTDSSLGSKDEPAYIIKGCFDYFEKVDSFSIVLVTELPYEGIHISQELFPCGGVPDEYCADSALVLISGNITSCVAGIQACAY